MILAVAVFMAAVIALICAVRLSEVRSQQGVHFLLDAAQI